MMRMKIAGGVGWLLGASMWLAATTAVAQQTPEAPPATTRTTNDDTAPLQVPTELVRAQPGGLTSEQAGARAATTSWNAAASQEALRGAEARVDEAFASFLPRLSVLGKYTRLSEFTPPSISFGQPGAASVVTTFDPNTAVPTGPVCNTTNPCFATPPGSGVAFPLILNVLLVQGTLTVPISDYLLRIEQGYTAATQSEEAARWDVVTARTTSAANGKIAYYTWLRNRGAVIVAVQSLNDQRTHLRDARNQFAAGNASKADVLRAETSVASAELAVERAKNLADLSEKQLRVDMHAPDGEALLPGEDLEAPIAPAQGNVKQMTLEALAGRPEIKSADANAESARQLASAARAGRYPALSAFGDLIGGSPNPRYFPQVDQFKFITTWDVGAQVTWSPNDVLVANGSVRDDESRAAVIEANKHVTRDNIEVEVTQDWQGVREADFSVETSKRELASAEEAYRVQRELFTNGRGTSTTLTDAETDLTRARLDLLNARADARIARIRLDHALGRDVAR